jgi:hypothetical protein
MSDAAPTTITAAWLVRARVTDDPEGDLIADMRSELRRSVEVPALFPNMAAMRDYLVGRGASREVLAAVPGVWRRYRRWVDQHRHTPAPTGETGWLTRQSMRQQQQRPNSTY